MGVNWNNIIRDQMRGVDPVTAFNNEERRVREKNRREYEEQVARRKAEQNKRRGTV